MKKLIFIIFILCLAQTDLKAQVNNKKWIEDLHFLADKMEKTYPDFYSRVPKELFDKTVNEIESKIPQLSEKDIVMELFRLIALPNDAHTIPFVFSRIFDLHDLPIKIFGFSDGWYIIDAFKPCNHLIGSKIVKINNTPINEVFEKFKPYLAAENEYSQLERFTYIGLVPEWLKSQGIISNLEEVKLTFEKTTGEKFSETLKAIDFQKKLKWSFIEPVENMASTAILNPRNDLYWYEYWKNSKTLYFQFNKVENQKGKETIAEFTKRLAEYLKTVDFNRFIVDIRCNMGGDDIFLKPLLELIRDNEKINQPNKLYVLIGRHTFSAAVLFAYKLKLQTKAIFVGEPTAQGPVFGGNATQVELPNSKLIFTIARTSTARTQMTWLFKTENKIIPDISIPYSYKHFADKKDPVIDSVLNYHAPVNKSIAIPKSTIEKYTGRYIFGSFHILEVKLNGSNLSYTLDDFSSYNLFRVQSDLYAKSDSVFETDLKNVLITFSITNESKAPSLKINWNDEVKFLKRAPDNITLVLELISLKRYQEAIQQIIQNKTVYASKPMFEDILNVYGYDLLNNEKIQDAIKVFELVVELFPDSWNAYDSLGEAFMKAGNKELAITNYEKSMQLNPNNLSGKNTLKKLRK